MVDYIFNQQTAILKSEFTEDVTLAEIVNYIISTTENITYSRLLKIKTNAKSANFKFSIDDLETILIENDKLLEKHDFIIEAMIVDNPYSTVISMLYQELIKSNKYRFKVFCTDEGASKWLENY